MLKQQGVQSLLGLLIVLLSSRTQCSAMLGVGSRREVGVSFGVVQVELMHLVLQGVQLCFLPDLLPRVFTLMLTSYWAQPLYTWQTPVGT